MGAILPPTLVAGIIEPLHWDFNKNLLSSFLQDALKLTALQDAVIFTLRHDCILKGLCWSKKIPLAGAPWSIILTLSVPDGLIIVSTRRRNKP
jgi:hypothetical protein